VVADACSIGSDKRRLAMSKQSIQKDRKATSSGHGALGMGGQPDDDPRDLQGGAEGVGGDDRGSHTGLIPGAFGRGPDVASGANETVGPTGDKGMTGGIDAAADAARHRR
jgi:hypothetical protein